MEALGGLNLKPQSADDRDLQRKSIALFEAINLDEIDRVAYLINEEGTKFSETPKKLASRPSHENPRLVSRCSSRMISKKSSRNVDFLLHELVWTLCCICLTYEMWNLRFSLRVIVQESVRHVVNLVTRKVERLSFTLAPKIESPSPVCSSNSAPTQNAAIMYTFV